MGIRQVVVSDISNAEILDDAHARVVVTDHPRLNNNTPIELDVTAEEAARFQTATIELVNLTIREPDRAPRRVVMEASTFRSLFEGVDLDDLVERGRPVARLNSRGEELAPRRAASASRAEKIDYLAANRFGQLHRGRVTEDEARLVREDLAQANANRTAAGQPEIDPSDPREKKRYGF